MDALITKRLHISGLTPALSVDDINQRFSSFGTVLSLEGFGLADGLGQPRKFGYVTVETTATKLAKCLNLLSGSTWKGAKLRIGEAKPDYAQRLAKEREDAQDLPTKRRKRAYGVYTQDMSLVTPENVQERPSWKLTPLGRMMRPIKMRPTHPLPLPSDPHQSSSKNAAASTTTKKRKREKLPDSRARRRTIDMTRWGSTHLTGVFLGANELVGLPQVGQHEVPKPHGSQAPVPQAPSPSPSPPPENHADAAPLMQNVGVDLVAEKSKTLDMLSSMFGDAESEWIGKETFDSDIEEGLLNQTQAMSVEEDLVTYEEVPQEGASTLPRKLPKVQPTRQDQFETSEEHAIEPPPAKPKPSVNLKDLFAPAEPTGFSLVGQLDLDLELDDELPFSLDEQHPSQPPVGSALAQSVVVSGPQVPIHIDNKQALFFPHPPDSSSGTKARLKDVFDLAKDNGWYWRDPNVGFYRTGTEEDIRKHWEEVKVDLTQGWKKRWREAGKMSRRRKTGGGEDAV